MVCSNHAKRIASLFCAFLLVLTLTIGVITPVSAATSSGGGSSPVECDKYSFLETICGMFNCYYAPEGMITELFEWENVSTYSAQFDVMLKNLEYNYKLGIKASGFQTTDNTAEDYVLPYLWNNGSSSASSIYNCYVSDGCLNFINSLGANEYAVLRYAFNKHFKLMYDYNYNLSDYSLPEIAQSVPLIPFSQSGTGLSFNVGYMIPSYWASDRSYNTNALESQLNFISTYSENGFGVEDYICYGPYDYSGYNYNLQYYLVGTYLEKETDLSNVVFYIGHSGYNSTVRIYNEPCIKYEFHENTSTHTSSLYNTSLYTNSTSSESAYMSCYTGYVDYINTAVGVSPLIGYYRISGKDIHNWGQDLIVGSSEAWKSYSSFTGELLDVYYPPESRDIDLIISNQLGGESNVEIIDNITQVATGTAPDSDESEVPEIDMSEITDAIDKSTAYIVDILQQTANDLLYGGDYSAGNDAFTSLDDKLNDYYDKETQLMDFTNLDSVVEGFWNTGSLLENAQSLSSISTYFMKTWDAFGPYILLFMTILALGLAAFLLKI